MPYSQAAWELRRSTGLDIAAGAVFLRALADHVRRRLRTGEAVHLPGIGTLRPAYFAPKTVVNNLPGRNRGKRYRIHNLRFAVRLDIAPALKRGPEAMPRSPWER